MADLDLLVEYVNHLHAGLDQAEKLTRAGALGPAVWVYLSVLEVDPDNLTARQQVGQVVTAVRQFDRAAPGRRWLGRMREGLRSEGEMTPLMGWLRIGLVILLILAAFALGYGLAFWSEGDGAPLPVPPPPKLGAERMSSITAKAFSRESGGPGFQAGEGKRLPETGDYDRRACDQGSAKVAFGCEVLKKRGHGKVK
jgi:hypothetical protein